MKTFSLYTPSSLDQPHVVVDGDGNILADCRNYYKAVAWVKALEVPPVEFTIRAK